HAANGADDDGLDHAMLSNRFGEFAELGVGELPARIAGIGLEEFDRNLSLCPRSIDMSGLAADISDQTCKTAAQSRTRFVGHRQLPWIQLDRSCFLLSVTRPDSEARAPEFRSWLLHQSELRMSPLRVFAG